MNEIWKDTHISDKYEVSNLGRVRIKNINKIMKPVTTTTGQYKQVGINKHTIKIHRLVMFAFKPDEYFEGAQVNHKNGIKTDNTLENLEWCTYKENRKHAVKNELIRKGNKHPNSILKEHQIPVIRNLYKVLKNQTIIAKLFKVDATTISKIITGVNWSHI